MTDRKINRSDDDHFYANVIRINMGTLIAHGIPKADAEALAEMLCARFCEEYGGQQPYVPTGRLWRLESRYAEIVADSKKLEINDLARKYKLSARWIRHILSRFNKRDFLARQSNLFEA